MQAEVAAGRVDLVLHPGDVSYVSPLLSPAALPRLIAPAGRRRHAALGRVPHQSAGQQCCVCVYRLLPRALRAARLTLPDRA
jgi:hypothetical protein